RVHTAHHLGHAGGRNRGTTAATLANPRTSSSRCWYQRNPQTSRPRMGRCQRTLIMEKYLTVKQRNEAENAVRSLLQAFDLDEGEHTANTPARVVKAWEERLSG